MNEKNNANACLAARVYENDRFTGERALFGAENITVRHSVFEDGESPLKHSTGVRLSGCIFRWKYPLWYCQDVEVEGTTLLETARSGIWYTKGIRMTDCTVDAPKTFRRSEDISLTGVTMPNALESLWNCHGVRLERVAVFGDYFGMGSSSVVADGLSISGNYAFDGGRDITIRNSRIISKDAFWNCENVLVENSVIIGEYLGWNSRNIRMVNCTVESNQGMCYIDRLEMEDCTLINTDLAFEYSYVDADIRSPILSVKNPCGGRIIADSIGEIIVEPERVDASATSITERRREEDEV